MTAGARQEPEVDETAQLIPCRLILDVSYALNGEDAGAMLARLREMCERAIGEGLLTGETAAEVDGYRIDTAVLSEPLDEDAVVGFMGQRIADGDLSLDDIPARLARYGLMEPHDFMAEMRERMARTDAG
jgi:hypothetical protein